MRWPTWDRAAPSPPAGLDTISRTNNFAVWSKNPSTCQTQAGLWGPAWHLHWKARSFSFSANPTSCKMQAEPSFRERDASKPPPLHPETISCPSVWDQPGLSGKPGAWEREMRSPTGKAVLGKQSSADKRPTRRAMGSSAGSPTGGTGSARQLSPSSKEEAGNQSNPCISAWEQAPGWSSAGGLRSPS